MKKFNLEEAKQLATQLAIDFTKVGFSAQEFLAGLHVELEHGLTDTHTNVTHDDPLVTAKIVLAHLNENHMYYDENIGVEAWEHALDQFKGDTKGRKIQIV
ncbi:MAG: hypothetical protein H7Y41_02210 [Hyphomonadaceae bacterium]|nr:hypothetical protein [Clostridia bacterium]